MWYVDSFYFVKASDSNANMTMDRPDVAFFLLFPFGGILCFDLCADVLDERELSNPIIIGHTQKKKNPNCKFNKNL